jgi:outer membrane lipoprotein LolB
MSASATARPGRTAQAAAAVFVALTLLAGCASLPPPQDATAPSGMQADSWSGRLSLQVEEDPPRQYSAAFELSGDALAGELRLSSPFGQLLALAQWQTGEATLRRGDQRQSYADLDTLTRELVGAVIPVGALFDWLQGRPTAVDGWEVDLSDRASGRLRAQRLQPTPAATLQLVIR